MKTATNIAYERVIQDEPENQASFLVEWGDRFAFCDVILGRTPEGIPLGLPREHPDKPGLYATSLAFQGHGPFLDNPPRFPLAVIVVEYAEPTWDCAL